MLRTELDALLDDILRSRRLLAHPFYRRWEAGALEPGELAGYAAQYRHFEATLPVVLEAVDARLPDGHARQLVQANLDDERGVPAPHIELFDAFADAVGARSPPTHPGHGRPRAAVRDIGRHLSGGGAGRRGRLRGPGAGHRRHKAEGLTGRYGLDAGGTRFWDVHAGVDRAHGAWMLDALGGWPTVPARCAGPATAAADAWWAFLDERQAAAPVPTAPADHAATALHGAPAGASVPWCLPCPRHHRVATTDEISPPPTGALTHRQVLIVFSGLMLGMLLAALDQTIVATALPTIVGDLHGLNHLSWVVTAYLLTTTLSTPLYGKISDLYGRKKIFQVAIVIFLIGSALSGLARNMDQLIAFRAVQGLGRWGTHGLGHGHHRRHREPQNVVGTRATSVGSSPSPASAGRWPGDSSSTI